MDSEAIVNQIETDGRRLIEVARSDLGAAVPTCGDWTLRDLAGHMGWVHGLVGSYVAGRATEPLGREQMPQVPDDDSAVDFAADALDRLVDALAGIDPDTPVWNWSPRPDAGFYFRRMLHETSVHRWDAENAVGETDRSMASRAATGSTSSSTSCCPTPSSASAGTFRQAACTCTAPTARASGSCTPTATKSSWSAPTSRATPQCAGREVRCSWPCGTGCRSTTTRCR